ncbi:MAG: hypothetical protein H0U25_10040 [Thermoleophilaceae bacterium]|nr:hypothetical protein [Thermoleophilaceae bacterium]
MIERAFERCQVRSFADLGGVWAVDGGYTFFALERFDIERAYLVDEDHTDAVRERAKAFPQLELVSANFGSQDTADRLGPIDAVVLFDVLLHQVSPDWDEILELYAPRTRSFVIVNPQWTGKGGAVRLLDLGREEYLRCVPPMDLHSEVFSKLDENNPRRGRPWRDVHDIWQWGISDAALTTALERLGFALVYFEDLGRWQGLDRFRNRAFAFAKEDR